MVYELLVLFHDSGQSSQDECHGWRSGDIEGACLELMMILISFQNVSISLFRHECRGQERRIHLTEPNQVLNTVSVGGTPYCLQMAPCLHLEFPLSCFPLHSTPYLQNDRNR